MPTITELIEGADALDRTRWRWDYAGAQAKRIGDTAIRVTFAKPADGADPLALSEKGSFFLFFLGIIFGDVPVFG
jgi:hypothetical protein